MRGMNRKGFLLLNGLAPRDRRAILMGLAVLLPVVIYVLGVKPYQAALEDVRDRVVAERELLARELDLLAAAPTLPEALHRAGAEAAAYEDRMVRAASGVIAEGELSGFLQGAAFRSRVLLEGIRSGELERGEEAPAGLSVVRLHLRGESDLEGVLTFLDEIENSWLFLRVRDLALEPQVARPQAEDGEEGQSGEPIPTGVVGFQMVVDGFARVEEGGS